MDSKKNMKSNFHSIEARYERAQSLMLGIGNKSLVQNDTIFSNWIAGSHKFWYEHAIRDGKRFILVDAQTCSKKEAFDHIVLASALAGELGQPVDHKNLPINLISINLEPVTVEFSAYGRQWKFKSDLGLLTEVVVTPADHVVSPDGCWVVFERSFNLWIKNIKTGIESALTSDGHEFFAYGAVSTLWGSPIDGGLQVKWSPDSRKLFTVQRDTRQVSSNPVVHNIPDSGGVRPVVKYHKVSYPGDEHIETYRLLIIDIVTKGITCPEYRQVMTCGTGGSFFNNKLGWWAKNSEKAYFIDLERGCKKLNLVEFDALSGATKVLLTETSDTYVKSSLFIDDFPAHIYLPDTNELVWCSERSGWNHLYLYDLESGCLKNQITEGKWLVRDVLYFDETRREVYIHTAGRMSGRDPYYRDICRVHLDTGNLVTICSGDTDYIVHAQESIYLFYGKIYGWAITNRTSGVSPDGDYLLTTRSRADTVPETVLVNRDGDELFIVETANIEDMPDFWRWPEPFQFKSSDGCTDLYGLVFQPSKISKDRRYPVINFMTGSPFMPCVLKGSFFNGKTYAGFFYLQAAALAELGFIVVMIDSRGTCFRSKEFQDHSYGSIASACDSSDHIAGIEQLSNKLPYMDLDRVGIYNPAGYQGGIYNLLTRSDFYKVGVVHLLQDTRLMPGTILGEQFEGLDTNQDKPYPENLVDDFHGKLFIMHPMLDPEHLPANTFRLTNALQRANKDFDMLMFPTLGHGWCSYQIRRSWDYFVTHLLGIEPPNAFNLKTALDSDVGSTNDQLQNQIGNNR